MTHPQSQDPLAEEPQSQSPLAAATARSPATLRSRRTQGQRERVEGSGVFQELPLPQGVHMRFDEVRWDHFDLILLGKIRRSCMSHLYFLGSEAWKSWTA